MTDAMTDMAEADLGPGELDLLEDALEELELDGALERWTAQELEPRVSGRLLDYRNVLAVAREALPLEDVPGGVLDDVLAQARQAAAAPAAAVAAVSEPWWTRLRRSFMVPALALAGTAALVLWVFDPKDQANIGQAPAAERAPAVRAEAGESKREQAPATAAAPTVAPAAARELEADVQDAEATPKEELADQAALGEAKLDATKNDEPAKPAEGAGRGMTSLGDVPGGVLGGAGGASPSPTQSKSGGGAGPASGRWDIVVRGDRARQAGDCVAARDEYALALEDDEARVRARAFAGLGLCDAMAGDDPSADANYERARGLDDEIGGYIESQNQRSRGAEKRKSKPAKKSKAQVDALDPFD